MRLILLKNNGYTLSNEKVFVKAKPQPASNPRLIIAEVVVGGAEASP